MNIHLPHTHDHNTSKLIEQIPEISSFNQGASYFQQLSDPTRLRLFWILCHCEECVINLAALMEMSSPALSHHLRLLKDAGLITSRRSGKEVYYTVAKNDAADALHDALENMMDIACPIGNERNTCLLRQV